MSQAIHPAAASTHLPAFLTGPGETDWLLVAMGFFLVIFVLAIGILYLHLHVLPDRIAHNKVQLQIVCVLGLLAMFTHMNIFCVVAPKSPDISHGAAWAAMNSRGERYPSDLCG
mgnify:CR=1 FL=1